MTHITLVGCGNMGFAMLEGWLKKPTDMHFTVVEPNEALRARAAKAGATVLSSAEALSAAPDLIFLAVKPQVLDKVAPEYVRFAGGTTTFISVAAGITMARLADWLPGQTPLIRTMPNTPAAIGQGMLVSCANEVVKPEVKAVVDQLLAASGETAWIDDENLMDAVTAISGSGPAYVFHFIECLADAGEALGLPKDLALQLARQTVAGSGALARTADAAPSLLREQVTSPGGTTAAGLGVLMAGDGALSDLLKTATRAARDRSVELGKI